MDKTIHIKSFVYSLVILSFFAVLFACGQSKKKETTPTVPQDTSTQPSVLSTQEKLLFEKVMHLHDSAMERMGEINQSMKQMRKLSIDTKSSEELKAQARDALEKLTIADKAMWDWMYGFRKKEKWNGKAGDYINYLHKQDSSMQIVNESIITALKQADQILNKTQ